MSEITCCQAARLWNITPRRVQIYCALGRISGARRAGRIWLLPSNAQKPKDPRTFPPQAKSNYWPCFFALNADLIHRPDERHTPPDAAAALWQKQLAGEIAYMRGDYKTASRCIEGIKEEDPSYLAALIISSTAMISMGDALSFHETWNNYSRLCTKMAGNPGARIMVELAQGTLAISAYAPKMSAAWLINGIFTDLPSTALPIALYLRGKAMLALGQSEQLMGMAEGALSLLPRGFGIEEAYLHIMLAHAYLYQSQPDRAREALIQAIDICLPKGFLSPLAENISSLLGLSERCLQETYPDQLPKILSLHKTLSESWLKVHNLLTHERITTILTRREYQVALSVASGLTNKESSRNLGISPVTLKGHLQNIYQKLNITSRKELRENIIIA